MWSKGAAWPAQHVAHNGLGVLVSSPPLLFYFSTTLSAPNREVNVLKFRDSHLMLVTKVHLALILARIPKKINKKERKI